MNTIDYKVINELMLNGRMTWAELGNILGLSSPATADRVKRLQEQGVIKGFTTLIDPEAVGCALTAFIAVTLAHPSQRQEFFEQVTVLAEIQECHHVAGDDDYLLKVRCQSTRDLERIINDELKSISGVTKTRTTIVLNTLKDTPNLPIFTKSSAPPTPRKQE